MATKRKTAAEIREEAIQAEAEEILNTEEDPDEETEPAEGQDAKDREIAKLKAEISRMKSARGATFTPGSRQDAERLMAIAEEAAEEGADPWTILVDVRVPKKSGAGDDDYWLNVNGISAQVPANGEVQKLKLPWAMTLMDSIAAEEMALDFADSIQVYDPKTNPKPVD